MEKFKTGAKNLKIDKIIAFDKHFTKLALRILFSH